jgi:hypothetical protein
MIMRVTKYQGKPHIILYKRDDGSETWMHADDYFVRHDLSHYAIEKMMKYKTAFMGMLNQGMDIRDFENREKRSRLRITEEAWYAENMANLFLIEIAQGLFTDFNQTAQEAFQKMNLEIALPVLNKNEIADIRGYLGKLLAIWEALAPGNQITLEF